MKKIAVIVNKKWEVEPMLNAMACSEMVPAMPFPDRLCSPRMKNFRGSESRAVFSLFSGSAKHLQASEKTQPSEPTLRVSVWCIQDLMYPQVPSGRGLDRKTQDSSSSEEKFRVLPAVLAGENPDLVMAVGTACYPADTSLNGSVLLGANFFIHDGHPGNPLSDLKHPRIGQVLKANVNDELFLLVNREFKNRVESRFLTLPRNPAAHAVCMASKIYTAISSINVTDQAEYNWVDPQSVEHFRAVDKDLPINSIETTHGVIKLCTEKPILFVSAITDRLGFFDSEVTPIQTYAACFNAGIVIGHWLLSLSDWVAQGNDFEP